MMSAGWIRFSVARICPLAAALAALVSLPAPVRAQARPAPAAEGTGQVTAAVEKLADDPSGLVKLFAKRLADVLAANNVALSPKLAGIPLQPNVVNPNDKDLARIHDTVQGILEPARSAKALPAALRYELLACVAGYCPSSAASMEAAADLVRAAQASLCSSASQEPPAVAATTAIREALYKCFDHVHCAWIDEDDVAAIKLAARKDLMGAMVYLLACEGDKVDPQGVAKAVEEVYRRVNEGAAPRETENAPGADDALRVLISQLDALRKETAGICELAAARKEVASLAQRFLSAVSGEDRPAALACAAPAMAKALEKLPSLRSAVGGEQVEKIEFLSIARFGAPGAKRFVDVNVRVTDKGGASRERAARLGLEKTPGGWRFAAQ